MINIAVAFSERKNLELSGLSLLVKRMLHALCMYDIDHSIIPRSLTSAHFRFIVDDMEDETKTFGGRLSVSDRSV